PAGGSAVARVPIKRTPATGTPTAKPVVEKPPAEDLAQGIVVGKTATAAAKAPGIEVELGNAGGIAPPPPAELPPVEDLGLGVAGTRTGVKESHAPVEDIPLGASGPGATRKAADDGLPSTRDMSLDLADHMAVRPDDVKEAVRASKVMSSVDVPPELLAALEDKTEKTEVPKA